MVCMLDIVISERCARLMRRDWVAKIVVGAMGVLRLLQESVNEPKPSRERVQSSRENDTAQQQREASKSACRKEIERVSAGRERGETGECAASGSYPRGQADHIEGAHYP